MKMKCVQQNVYEYENDINGILNMCMINDQLWWCFADGEIRIFNKNCKLERQIMVDEVQNVCVSIHLNLFFIFLNILFYRSTLLKHVTKVRI